MRTTLVQILQIPVDGQFLPLPDWARFFVEVGTALGELPNDGKRRVIVAIATPTRAYAAALCGVGIVGVRAETPVATDALRHFQYLRSLPPRTTVTYRDRRKKRKGWLLPCVTKNGQMFLVIKSQAQEGGGFTRPTTRPFITIDMIPASESLSVQVADGQLRELPERVTSRVLREQPGLMGGILAQSMLSAFLRDSRLECVIVGNESLLREEVVRAPFAVVPPSGAPVCGKLQDILRVHHITGGNESYRSELYSATGGEERPSAGEARPPVVIFDGSLAFLRWTATWPQAHWVAMLDRSDVRFEEAAQEINDLYINKRMDGGVPVHIQQVPQSLECMAFEVSR